ncbi:MAG: restriction endonuclease subunit R, partial [Gammaproteobacteria bacterium]
ESVKQKIFKRRLELSVVLQNGDPENEALADLGSQLKDQMHSSVDTMNLDNFIVRKHRQDVETFAKRERWLNLNEDDMKVLADKLSGLPTQDDDDEFSRRFDLLILNLQLAILQNDRSQETYQSKVREVAKGLENKAAIPGVYAQMELIIELITDDWWQGVTLPMLEDVRLRLRDLIRFIDPEKGLRDVYTDFEDEIGEATEGFNVVKTDPNLKDYKQRVQRFIRDHQDHITVRRLKNNEPVSKKDIEALEDILFSDDGPIARNEYENLYGELPVGYLVRSIVGLDRNAVTQVFADLLEKVPLHPDQISFLDEVIRYLMRNGIMEPKVMFDAPFTHINTKGVAGIFGDEDGKKVVELVREINGNANVG